MTSQFSFRIDKGFLPAKRVNKFIQNKEIIDKLSSEINIEDMNSLLKIYSNVLVAPSDAQFVALTVSILSILKQYNTNYIHQLKNYINILIDVMYGIKNEIIIRFDQRLDNFIQLDNKLNINFYNNNIKPLLIKPENIECCINVIMKLVENEFLKNNEWLLKDYLNEKPTTKRTEYFYIDQLSTTFNEIIRHISKGDFIFKSSLFKELNFIRNRIINKYKFDILPTIELCFQEQEGVDYRPNETLPEDYYSL